MPTARTTTSKPKPPSKPALQHVDDKLYWQSSAGEVVIPLGLKTGLYRRMVNAERDQVNVFADLLDELGLNDALAAFDDLELSEAAKVSEAYFVALAEHMGATLGEAGRSSN